MCSSVEFDEFPFYVITFFTFRQANIRNYPLRIVKSINILSGDSYNIHVEKIVVTESGTDCSHIAYLYHTLHVELPPKSVSTRLDLSSDRAHLEISCQKELLSDLKKCLLSCTADIIGIAYKYSFLRGFLKISGLTLTEKEILLTSLVAADFQEEKKYLLNRIDFERELCIDGLFTFRLQALKEKWVDILELLPESFTRSEFDRFICFLLEGDDKKIFLKDDEVFDERYQKQRRSRLIGTLPEISFLREILLSGANKICCLTVPKEEDREILKKYYAGRVFFT